MKKSIIKIAVISLVLSIVFMINSYAESSFRINFEEGTVAKQGETVEIPIIIDKINMEAIDKGVLEFQFKIDYDDVFSLVPYSSENVLQLNNDLAEYGLTLNYNPDTKKVISTISSDYVRRENNSLVEHTVLATAKFKVSEEAVPADYQVSLRDVELSNGENFIENGDVETTVTVISATSGDYTDDEIGEGEADPDTIDISRAREGIKWDIAVSKDGKKVAITIDDENGAKVAFMVVDGKVLDRNGNTFTFDSEPNNIYTIRAYGYSGELLATRSVITTVNEENTAEEEQSKEESKSTNPKTIDIIVVSAIVLMLGGLVLTKLYLVKKKIK